MYDVLCQLMDVKMWMDIPQNDSSRDAQISALIKPVSQLIGRFCGRDNLGAVLSYTERHAPKNYGLPMNKDPKVFLQRYPVVTLTQVTMGYNTGSGATAIPIVTDPTSSTGAYLDEDLRTIWLLGTSFQAWSGPVVITYTAGYVGFNTPGQTMTVPEELTQAAAQWIKEILTSKQFTGFKSQSMGQQTVSYDLGNSWAMSNRTKAMLMPHRNVAPWGRY